MISLVSNYSTFSCIKSNYPNNKRLDQKYASKILSFGSNVHDLNAFEKALAGLEFGNLHNIMQKDPAGTIKLFLKIEKIKDNLLEISNNFSRGSFERKGGYLSRGCGKISKNS